MNLKLKHYKLLKTKQVLENNSLILISNKLNVDHEKSLILKKNYKFYLVRNKLLKKLSKSSVLYNLNSLINGNIVLLTFKKNVSTVVYTKNKIPVIGLILNKKLYSARQLTKLKNLDYKSHIKDLYNLLNFNLVFNSATFKNISK